MSKELCIERREGYQLWLLDRPTRRNAVGLDLLKELNEAWQYAVEEGVTTVVLGATGEVFCAGFDLDELHKLSHSSGQLPHSPLHDFLDRFEPPSFTLITAIQGPAYGGGVELALLGDVRIASPKATFLLPPARLGIIYPERGLRRLREALGSSLLRTMLVTAQPASATRLFQQGALWSLEDDPLTAACSLAAHLVLLPAHSRLGNAAALEAVSRTSGIHAAPAQPSTTRSLYASILPR
ncbi:MAG: enoyl-CoA hydratase/isomerase family protein [Myxococcales bacterium]|nr:enoyl-CoA hydratase/isomerase family protein [Polyangiaceae bacterium]MDW8248432.1 enoyl-CoA hydratase/isomerase family protein [Myxococcales bacterium]